MSRREHTVKLPHGFRIECVTESNRSTREVTLVATSYAGTKPIMENHASRNDLRTCGELIAWRGAFLNHLAGELA